jgi:uncharacterized sulfatase
MDERYDMIRSVRDQRYVYVRNYMPHKIYGQHVDYMFQTPTTRIWKKLYDEGKLAPPKTFFWETKPPEELYDLTTDPDEVNNLAGSPQHQEVLERLRQAQQQWTRDIRDVGFLPEDEIHTRSVDSSPYEVGHDERRYPMQRIMGAAELASSLKPEATARLIELLGDDDSAVRYWAAMGILMRGTAAVEAARPALRKALQDPSSSVGAVAAEALGRYGNDEDAAVAVKTLVELAHQDRYGVYVAMLALNALDALGDKAKVAVETIKNLPTKPRDKSPRAAGNVPHLIESITGVAPPADVPPPAKKPRKAAKASPAKTG